jgi:hypothetical protein
MGSDTNVSWQSHIWNVECDGWIHMHDGWSWILVEEYIEGDFVWVHRELVTDED